MLIIDRILSDDVSFRCVYFFFAEKMLVVLIRLLLLLCYLHVANHPTGLTVLNSSPTCVPV